MSLRTSQGVYQGNQHHEKIVQQIKNKIGISRKNITERSQEKDLKERTSSKLTVIQQSQKVIAQQILKNNQMINKYNTLDAQLQNVTFEYLFYH